MPKQNKIAKLNNLIDLIDQISYLGISFGITGQKKDDRKLVKAKSEAFKIIDLLINETT